MTRQARRRVILTLAITAALTLGPAEWMGASAVFAATRSAEAVVLVDSGSASHADFQHFVQPYLDHFGIAYTVLDIATSPVEASIGNYAVIIVGHRGLDPGGVYLDSTEESYISGAVSAGAGLVNFDNDLSASGGTARYEFVQTIFGFVYGGSASDSGVYFPGTPSHYVTDRHPSGSSVGTAAMTLAGITDLGSATALATTGSQPFLAVVTHGTGRAVQWGSYDWMSHAVKGPLFGLEDLVWRGIVWAARKPFVMQGLPPFVTMRMDDVSGPLWWIHDANDYGFVPWAGVFTDDFDASESADLSALVNAQKATATLHAFGSTRFFYFDHYVGADFDDPTMVQHYSAATAWFGGRNIPLSKYLVPHFYEIGSNAFGGLSAWGTEFLGTMMDPGQLESGADWMMKGPFRLYETGTASDRNHNPYYADFMTVPDHPEHEGQFFNCVTEVRDVTGYEWLGNGRTGVTVAIQDGTDWLKRPLDGMSLATLFSHEYTFIGSMSQADWRAALQGITDNIAGYGPVFVSMDHACRYVRAVRTSDIDSASYDDATNQIAVSLTGVTDLATQFHVFTENAGQITGRRFDVPPFTDATQVVLALPGPLDHVVVEPDPASVGAGASQQFTAQGYDAGNLAIPNLACAWAVVNGGGTIDRSGLFTAGTTQGAYADTVRATCESVAGYATVEVPPPPPGPDEGPGGPILVIASSANPFTRYYAEILRAEGLNEYLASDIANVTPSILANYDVAILGEMALTPDQVTMLADWVNAGGNLVAMRPDKQLAGLLGLTDAASTQEDAYLLVDASAAPGAGIVSQTIQYHGAADLYTLNGASAVATLYSDASTPSAYPAVTLRSVGSNGGQAAAFTYDLARSIVYTRQGNPAWAGQERDDAAPIRSDDLFYGPAPEDPQPDWVDLDRVAVPQADEQQRLLANVILEMNADRKPLPRFWYFPDGKKAVIVMTADEHGGGDGARSRFESFLALDPSGCVVDDWQCVRSSAYIYANGDLTAAEAASYTSLGFEIGAHVNTGCADFTPASLQTNYSSQLASFDAIYPALPRQASERIHCVVWSDWATQPKVQLQNGIRLDVDYYYWPSKWFGNRYAGMFTGSGIPMRFADLDGTTIDVYQVPTQMTDESGQPYSATCDTLLDRARGPEGYYGAFAVNIHSDGGGNAATDLIVGSAQDRGVPVVSGRQLLGWLDGRNGSSFGSFAWGGGGGGGGYTLSFTVTAATGARGLEGMLPVSSPEGDLASLTRGGEALAYRTERVKGIEYAIFPATSGAYLATYQPDTTPPVISGVSAAPRRDGTADITWSTDGPANSRVDYGTEPDALTQIASDPAFVISHTVALTGLAASTTYYYRVVSADGSGNTATYPDPPELPLTFVTPSAVCFYDDTEADFAAGTLDADGYVAATDDGEVTLAPTEGAEFSGASLPGGWSVTPWTGGTATFGGGAATVDGAMLWADVARVPGRTLEFVAAFSGDGGQHAGFGVDLNSYPWAIFSTKGGGGNLWARTSGTETELVGVSNPYAEHRFRIEWTSSSVAYYVDDVPVATHAVAIAAGMRPVVSDWDVGAGAVVVDWIRVSPYRSPSTFLSRVFGDGSVRSWGQAAWSADLPEGATLEVRVRTGDSETPGDGSWSGFAKLPASGARIGGDSGYIQYRLDLASTQAGTTPALRDMDILCASGPDLAPPTITGRSPAPGATGVAVGASVVVDFGERMDSGTITTATFRLRAAGETSDVPAVVTRDGYRATLDPVGALEIGTVYTVTVDGSVADTAGNPLGADDVWTFTTSGDLCMSDTTVSEFGAGVATGAYVADASGGEIILLPTAAAEFSGTTLPDGWQSAPWNGYATIGDGVATLESARLWTTGDYAVGRSLEFSATFGAGRYQHVGFVRDQDFNTPWAMFSTSDTSTSLYARVNTGSASEDVLIPGSWLGAPHRFRVDWNADGIVFWIDGESRYTSSYTISQAMKIVASDRPELDGTVLTVDWIHLSPYPAPGAFESRVLDGGRIVDWSTLAATMTLPSGAAVSFETRTGNTDTPGGGWSGFQLVNGGAIDSPSGRYLQYRATLNTPNGYLTPVVADVSVCGAGCIPTSTPESVCNGADDDCDGAVDEDYASQPTTCGVGACIRSGMSSCVGGVVQDNCTPGTPGTESCDGIDNDCDGAPDSGDPEAAASCDDSIVCTTDACGGSSCVYTASGACDLAGTVHYYRDNGSGGSEPSLKPVPNVGIDDTGDSAADDTTDTNGAYGFDDLFGNVAVRTLSKYGSPRASDHNDAITSYDASLIAQHAVRLITLTANQQIAGNVSGTGGVTAYDASLVSQFAVRRIDHFPVATGTGSDWRFLGCDSSSYPVCGNPEYGYTPMTGPATADFYAILYGEVSGNWVKAGGLAAAATGVPEAEAAARDREEIESRRLLPRQAEPPSARTAPAFISLKGWASGPARGTRRVLLVALQNADGVEALDLELKYDPARIAIADVQAVDLASEFHLAKKDVPGSLKIALYGTRALKGAGSILAITVETRGAAGGRVPIIVTGQANEGQIPLATEHSRQPLIKGKR